jgi:hypothetical protein
MSLNQGQWYRYREGWWLPVVQHTAYGANASLGPYLVPVVPQAVFSAVLTVHSVSGTNPTLTVSLTFFDVYPYEYGNYTSSSTAIFQNISAAGVYTYSAANTPYTVIQLGLSLGGTSPSFTISLSVYVR